MGFEFQNFGRLTEFFSKACDKYQETKNYSNC